MRSPGHTGGLSIDTHVHSYKEAHPVHEKREYQYLITQTYSKSRLILPEITTQPTTDIAR